MLRRKSGEQVPKAATTTWANDPEEDMDGQAPQWTCEAPTEPGLYWYAMIDSEGVRRHCQVFIAEFGKHKGKACIIANSWDGGQGNHPASIPHRVWAGPLCEPIGWASHADRVSDGD